MRAASGHFQKRHGDNCLYRMRSLCGLSMSFDRMAGVSERSNRTETYKRTGNPRACQLLPGHTRLESIVRYLGVEVDDALLLSEQTDL